MAQMLPDNVDTVSPASEKRMFQHLRDDPAIHAFKGLANAAVVLVDLGPPFGQATGAWRYAGMTRARARLIMLWPQTARNEIARRERENLIAAVSRG